VPAFGVWDLALLVVVSLQATVLSYVHHPKWKAFIWTLPLPFTVASLAVNRPIDATNVAAISVMVVFTHGVRILHQSFRVPIVASIVLGTIFYCAIGWALAGVLPTDDRAFWIACAATIAFGVVLYFVTPHRDEPGHRSPMPVWQKLPLVAAVVMMLVLIKNSLLGFMTFFPMVGVIAAYEARKSLWAISRQVPVVMMTAVPLMIACRLAQPRFGLHGGLAIGWVVFGLILAPLTRHMWATAGYED
jgi:hypothetical protein